MIPVPSLLRALASELLKLRRGSALRLAFALPLVFVLLDFAFLGRPLLRAETLTRAEVMAVLPRVPLSVMDWFWMGFFHPLLLALLPGLVARPEHRARAWKHLHAQPIRPWVQVLAKALVVVGLATLSISVSILLLRTEWAVLAHLKPLLEVPFPWQGAIRQAGWALLGSLPLLMLYLWVSQRINTTAVPIVFGLLGVMLTLTLRDQELHPLWKRDLIPWLLPQASAQHAIRPPSDTRVPPEQRMGYTPKSQRLPDGRVIDGWEKVEVLPNGRRLRTWSNFVMTPPPPTPGWLLAGASSALALLFLFIGLLDARGSRG